MAARTYDGSPALPCAEADSRAALAGLPSARTDATALKVSSRARLRAVAWADAKKAETASEHRRRPAPSASSAQAIVAAASTSARSSVRSDSGLSTSGTTSATVPAKSPIVVRIMASSARVAPEARLGSDTSSIRTATCAVCMARALSPRAQSARALIASSDGSLTSSAGPSRSRASTTWFHAEPASIRDPRSIRNVRRVSRRPACITAARARASRPSEAMDWTTDEKVAASYLASAAADCLASATRSWTLNVVRPPPLLNEASGSTRATRSIAHVASHPGHSSSSNVASP